MSTQINAQWVTVPQTDLVLEAYFAYPATDAPVPGVIVLQEIFGVNTHIQEVTERLALAGYGAIAPALYQRLAPGFATGYTEEAIVQGKAYKAQTKTEELLGDLQATLDFLYQSPQILKTGVGMMGFCFGGLVAYLGATLPEVKATASFYGAGIVHGSPGGGKPALDYTSAIGGTLYAFFGLADASIPPTEVDLIEQRLQSANVAHRVFRYPGADHGFFCDQRSSYHPQAAQDAWHQVLALLETLKAGQK